MKFVALVSGGKDSYHATLRAIENGHELACCAHLAPPLRNDDDDGLGEDESYMYQTAGSEAVRAQVEECVGVPFYVGEIRGRSENTSLVYDAPDDGDDEAAAGAAASDEVEDLRLLLRRVKRAHPDVAGVSSGAILSTYQRTRIENVCSRLNLTSLSYLWRMSCQRTLLDSILDDGEIDAVLVRVACPPGLMPYRHLGKSLRELRDNGTLDRLKDRFGMHPAGEGGEYETLVLDCPRLFRRGKLVLEETEVVCDESDDGIGVLRITKCSVERRDDAEEEGNSNRGTIDGGGTRPSRVAERVREAKSSLSEVEDGASIPADAGRRIHESMHLPNVRTMKGGLCHVSALLSPIACNTHEIEADAAVEEFLSIRQMLQIVISRLFPNDVPSTSPRDVLYVHLYLSEISHFAKINAHYKQFFGMHLPPSRSCVAVGRGALPGGRRVMMDCVLQRGSGGYLRGDGNADDGDGECDTFLAKALRNKHHSLRRVLHVQSISSWAPVCIGPYSQANVLRSSLVFLAGMIGLVPESMTLIEPPPSSDVSGWEVQLYQSWRNAAAVLDGLDDGGGKLEDCLGGLVYFSAVALESVASKNAAEEGGDFPWNKLWSAARCICDDALATNAGVVMGSVDGTAAAEPPNDADPALYDEDGVLYGGYEDEETWREMSGDAATSPSLSSHASENPRVPLLMVCLQELPAHAQAEVELVCASRRAAACLSVGTGSLVRTLVPCRDRSKSASPLDGGILWDTGYDHASPPAERDRSGGTSTCIQISSVARYVGLGCACVSTTIASWKPGAGSQGDVDSFDFDMEGVLSKMIDSSIDNARGEGELGSLFTIGDVLNVRVYYKVASVSRVENNGGGSPSLSVRVEMVDDGSMLRTQLYSVLRSKSSQYRSTANIDGDEGSADIPAYTVVPVLGMHLRHEEETSTEETGMPLMAMQVSLTDAIRTETEMWARHDRRYEYDN